jgi:hypothetical protein
MCLLATPPMIAKVGRKRICQMSSTCLQILSGSSTIRKLSSGQQLRQNGSRSVSRFALNRRRTHLARSISGTRSVESRGLYRYGQNLLEGTASQNETVSQVSPNTCRFLAHIQFEFSTLEQRVEIEPHRPNPAPPKISTSSQQVSSPPPESRAHPRRPVTRPAIFAGPRRRADG